MDTIRYIRPDKLKELTYSRKQEFTSLFKKLKAKKPKNLDDVFHELHIEAFVQFDCLTCANCCSTMYQILNLTHKNCEVCPVVYCITGELVKSQK